MSLQILWKTTRKFVLPARLSKDYCVGLTFVVGKGRIRVERDPALCGRLNEEVGHLGGVTEPRDKSCVSCVLAESRLEGVNRRNLKFISLNTHYKSG